MRGKQFLGVVSLMFVLAALAQAQGPRGTRNYDPSTETTVKGRVKQVQQVPGRHGWNATHLVLETEAGILNVHVGPSSYISGQGFSFRPGDEVEVLGSKLKLANSEAVIAREIKKEDKRLMLRDAQGIPQWAGGRRRIP